MYVSEVITAVCFNKVKDITSLKVCMKRFSINKALGVYRTLTIELDVLPL